MPIPNWIKRITSKNWIRDLSILAFFAIVVTLCRQRCEPCALRKFTSEESQWLVYGKHGSTFTMTNSTGQELHFTASKWEVDSVSACKMCEYNGFQFLMPEGSVQSYEYLLLITNEYDLPFQATLLFDSLALDLTDSSLYHPQAKFGELAINNVFISKERQPAVEGRVRKVLFNKEKGLLGFEIYRSDGKERWWLKN